MLAAARMRWLMLLFAYYSIQWLAAFVPAVGPLAMMIGRPVFTVGFLAAAWTQQRGGVPRIGHLFHGFRTDLRALLPIGVVLVAGTIFAVLATALVDGGALLDMISARRKAGRSDRCKPARRDCDALRHRLRAADAARRVVRARAGRLSGLQRQAGARDEPSRRAGELASARRLRIAALLLWRRAAGNGDRDHRRRRAERGGTLRDRAADRRSLLPHVLRRAGDLRLRRVSRRLPSCRSRGAAGSDVSAQ